MNLLLSNPSAVFHIARTLYNNPLTRDIVTSTLKTFGKRSAAGLITAAGVKKSGDLFLPSPPQTKDNKRKRAKDYEPSSKPKKMPKYANATYYKKSKKGRAKKRRSKYIKKKQPKRDPKTQYAAGGLVKVYMGYKKPKAAQALKQLRSDVVMLRRGAFVNGANPGFQSGTNIFSKNTCPMGSEDLLNFFETGAKRWVVTTNQTGVVQSSVYETIPGKDATVGLPITDRTGKRIYIDNVNVYVNMSNQGPTTLEYTVYWLMSKNTEKTFRDPLSLWQDGLIEASKNITPTSDRDEINAKPTTSREFNFVWTIVKKQIGRLDPGSEQKINFKFQPKRFIDVDYLNDHEMIKGITLFPILVCKGVPADTTLLTDPYDQKPGWNTVASNVTTSRTKLVGTFTNRYYGYVCDTWGATRRSLGGDYPTSAQRPIENPTGDYTGVFSIADAAGTVVDSNYDDNFA